MCRLLMVGGGRGLVWGEVGERCGDWREEGTFAVGGGGGVSGVAQGDSLMLRILVLSYEYNVLFKCVVGCCWIVFGE